MTQLLEKACAELVRLPDEEQNRIAMQILAQLEKPEDIAPPKRRRIGGLHRGMTKMSDDFAAPLPDDFWTENE